MKKVLIIGGMLDTEQRVQIFTTYADGVKRVLDTHAEVFSTHIRNLQVVIDNNRFEIYDTANNLSLAEVDLVAIHAQARHYDIAYVISRFCAHYGIAYFNDFTLYYPGTKIGQAVVFFEAGAPIPKTLYALDDDRLMELLQREMQVPFILKDAQGTNGESNYLIKDFREVRERLAAQPTITFVAQSYCPNDRDYRVLLAPDQVLTIERRGAPDTHLNNTSSGAAASVVEDAIPDALLATARAVAGALGLTLSGVDIIPHLETGELYFLEINSQPQLFSGACLEEKAAFVRQSYLDILQKDEAKY